MQRLIPTGERSGLQTHIATTESVSLRGLMKSGLRLWNWKSRFGVAVGYSAWLRTERSDDLLLNDGANAFVELFLCPVV